MRAAGSARRRVKYELAALIVLAVAAGLILLGRPSRPAGGELFQWKAGEYVLVWRGEDTSDQIDESRFSDLTVKNADDLAAWAQMAWENQWGYLWGTYGNVLDEDLLAYKIDQYGDAVLDYEDVVRDKWMGRRVADCVGLIKGYGWYDPDRHDIIYGYGDMPDVGTDGLYERAVEKGPVDTMPETPGLLVYAPGHIGVYVGGGWVVEAISHAGGVVKTRLADRTWTHWMQCPFIEY